MDTPGSCSSLSSLSRFFWVQVFGGGFLTLVPIAAVFGLFGALIWTGATGRWFGGRRRATPILRVLLPLIPLAANGFVAVIVGLLVTCSGDFCGGKSIQVGVGYGLAVFLGMMITEVGLFFIVNGIIKAGRVFMRS